MAKKSKSTTSSTTVRRIKANDDAPKKSKAAKVKKTSTTTKKSTVKKNPLKATAGYFKGAWRELKLVRWPTRSATWAMTIAVLLFTAIFIVLILLLDAGFNWAFEQILK